MWVSHLRRELVSSGLLRDLIRDAAVRGVSSDLDVLAAAVAGRDRTLGRDGTAGRHRSEESKGGHALGSGSRSEHALEALLVDETRAVAEALSPVYEETNGRDGFVSVEVLTSQADEADEAADVARAAHRLHSLIGLPNVVFKVPSTASGLALCETLTAEGRHVHIGPLFSVGSVCRATEAFVRGLRRFLAAGGELQEVAAVASVQVNRLDATVDELLIERIRGGSGDTSAAEALIGSCAVATAKVACRRQRQLLDEALGVELGGTGPSRMRLMWSGTASKDPRFPGLRYIESLVGPDTVIALSLPSLRAFAARGKVEAKLGVAVDNAVEILSEIGALGIDLEAVGARLERDAFERRAAAAARLARDLRAAPRAAAPQAAAPAAGGGGPADSVAAPGGGAPSAAIDVSLVRRLWDKDPSLWTADPNDHDLIRNRLGWLELPEAMSDACEPLQALARRVDDEDFERIALLGMGGSSLTAAVCKEVFEADRFVVLDSTVPAAVRAVSDHIDPARTMVLVASKSGTTVEVRALADHFYAQATPMLEHPGARFGAITDPGTPLEQLALERGFDRAWLAPGDVGGRFSALSVFGLVPMALMGVDLERVLAAARTMAARCEADVAPTSSPGVELAAWLHAAHAAGRDKLTFLASPEWEPFGAWAEQLVAESTGKNGVGLVPVCGEPEGAPQDYGDDRAFVVVAGSEDNDPRREQLIEGLTAAGHPLYRLRIADRYELGGELFRWEFGVALLGALMGINPFDQPDVQDSKSRTAAFLESRRDGETSDDRPPLDTGSGWAVFADLERDEGLAGGGDGPGVDGWLRRHLGRAKSPDYVGIQAFLHPQPGLVTGFERMRETIRRRLGVATTFGWGPAFLHSTGQLHKGGPNTGVFLQITADSPIDVDCPGLGVTFGNLVRAQARGDLEALQQRGRRVLRVHLSDASRGVTDLAEAVDRALA